MPSKIFAGLLLTFAILLSSRLPIASPPQLASVRLPDFLKSSQIKISKPASLEKNFITDIKQLPEAIVPLGYLSPFPKVNHRSLPVLNENVDWLNLKVMAAASFETGNNRFLFQKNIDEPAPIASLTKILTALVVLDQMNLEEVILVSKRAVDTYEDFGNLRVGEKLTVRNLLYIMLLQSSNDAAAALSEGVEQKKGDNILFVNLMNQKAKKIGLTDSFFTDPSGLNLDNISTAADLIKLTQYSLENPQYSFVWQILGTKEIDVQSADGAIEHHLQTTNKLLGQIPEVLGGKTGYTEEARECLILVLRLPAGQYLLNVILGAGLGERFIEVERLVNWTKQVYFW